MLKRIWLFCFCVWFFVAPSYQVKAFAPRPTGRIESGLKVIKSDDEAIVLELYTPGYRIEEKAVNGTVYDLLEVEGFGQSAEVGKPQLPVEGVMLGIPADADFIARVVETDYTLLSGQFNIYPVPKAVLPDDFHLQLLEDRSEPPLTGIEFVFTKDEKIYSTDTFYPPDLAEVASSGFIRDQRFVQLQLHPFQYNPVTQQVRLHKRMKVELRFTYEGKKSFSKTGSGEFGGPFEGVMRNSLLNYESAKGWRSRAALRSTNIQGENPPASQLSWKIAVNEDGIYKLSYDDLSSEGFPSGVISPTLKLFNEGSEVAIYVDDPEGSFDSGDYILFYGQGLNTKYTDTNIYWLMYGGADGHRMPTKDGTPSPPGTVPVPVSFGTTRHLEENPPKRDVTIRMANDDHWWWKTVQAPGSNQTQTFTFTLENISTEAYSTTLRADMHGVSYSDSVDPDHHTKTYLNGNVVEDAWWDGFVDRVSTTDDFPSSYLLEGTNTISVTAPLDTGLGSDKVYVNWFEIDYRKTYVAENDSLFFAGDGASTWQYEVSDFSTDDVKDNVFDITDPANVSRIINAVAEPSSSYTLRFEDTITDRTEYLALTTAQQLSPLSVEQDTPSDLHATSNGADYIIITHSDFYAEVLPLAERRAAQGPRTMIVDVQDIYDEFNYGVFKPEAIHDFLQYAYENWVSPAPSYVLLVGNGNFDFRCYWKCEPNYIPPYMFYVDYADWAKPELGEVASDNRFATVSGDDMIPDFFIGRLPVSSSAEASIVVNKILTYEQSPPGGDWNQKALFVADNIPDASGDFVAYSNDLVDNYLPSSYAALKVYLNDYCGEPTDPPTPCPAATSPIIDTISDGVLLVSYIGHGSRDYWAHEKVFEKTHIPSLSNDGKLPIFLSMSCLTGDFAFPGYDSLDDSLLRVEGKGSIANWSSTWLGKAQGHHYLDVGFFKAVFTGDPLYDIDEVREIGPATYFGKLYLSKKTTGYLDLIDTYTLFGDPFMKLNLPPCDAADFNNDGQIMVDDIMQVAAHWDTRWGEADYDRKYDLDDDGEITADDILQVAAQWRETCAAP